MKAPLKGKKKNSSDYEQLGKIVASVYESGYLDKKTMYKTTFLKGVLQGLGGVVGATIVVTLLLWMLTLFNSLPVIGDFVQTIQTSIDSKK